MSCEWSAVETVSRLQNNSPVSIRKSVKQSTGTAPVYCPGKVGESDVQQIHPLAWNTISASMKEVDY